MAGRRQGGSRPRRRSLSQRLAAVRLIVCDVDGVLTDGRILVGDDGREIKPFSVLDGTGFALARTAGIKTAWLSARTSPAVEHRGRECHIDWVLQGVHAKAEALEQLCADQGIPLAHAAYLGDDLIDLPVFAGVGLAVAVANAVDEVKRQAHWVTRRPGGGGALRELVERILRSQKRWPRTVADYLRTPPPLPSERHPA